MFAAVLDFLFFLFVTFFLVPSLVVFAHLMRSWARREARSGQATRERRSGIRDVESTRDEYSVQDYPRMT